IAQLRSHFVEDMLNCLNITFTYELKRRSYVISGWQNWSILAKLRIADMHPRKRERFWDIFAEFQEIHYSPGYLKKQIARRLDNPLSVEHLASFFNRSNARISETLVELKKEGAAKYFKVGSRTVWVSTDKDIVVISKVKQRYLDLIDTGLKRTHEFAKELHVCHKSAKNRLSELEKLGIVNYDCFVWQRLNTKEEALIQ
ncbi:MAG: hypothetical protein ACTSWQ_08390, partial [Candidatus Thorarchaeota archaeon]